MTAMQRLGRELKKIQQKYKGDRERLNAKTINLYKEHGADPAGGCLPMLPIAGPHYPHMESSVG